MSPDPSPRNSSTGDPGGLNLCAYANNDPVNQNDPSGLGSAPKSVSFDGGGYGCVSTGLVPTGGAIDASNACPPGMTIAYDRGGGCGLSGTGMTAMGEQSIRNGALLKSGTLFPNPRDLALSGQNE